MPRLTVNDRPVEFALDPETPLLFAMRDVANLTGAKHGCEDESCHACTMLVDGQAVPTCRLPLRELEGAVVTSVEGLPADDPVIAAWVEEQVSLCGFCDPGFRCAINALLTLNLDPDDAALAALPNRCPCGAGPRIASAARTAARRLREGPTGSPSGEFSLGSGLTSQNEPNRMRNDTRSP